MLVVVTSRHPRLDAPPSSAFGRGPWLLFVRVRDRSTASLSFEAVENASEAMGDDAPHHAALMVQDCGGEVVLAPAFDPPYLEAIEALDITWRMGRRPTVRDLVRAHLSGLLPPTAPPPEHLHQSPPPSADSRPPRRNRGYHPGLTWGVARALVGRSARANPVFGPGSDRFPGEDPLRALQRLETELDDTRSRFTDLELELAALKKDSHQA